MISQVLAVSRWGTFCRILWPETRGAGLGGIALQFGRALDETMAMLMVAGNVVQLAASVFDPVRTLRRISRWDGLRHRQPHTALFLSSLPGRADGKILTIHEWKLAYDVLKGRVVPVDLIWS